MNLAGFFVLSLAVWRLTHAMVKEKGPLDCFARLRARLAASQKRSGGFFDMISCTSCLSLWTGLVASLFVSQTLFEIIVYAFAFSGASMLLESLFSKQSNSFALVTPPAGNDKVTVRAGSTSK